MSNTLYTLTRAEKGFIATAQDSHDTLSILEDCIVDVFPPYAKTGCHQLVYVTIADEPADEKTERRTSLNVIPVPDLSDDIITEYTARSQWFLPALLDNTSSHPNLHIIISVKSGHELARTVYDNLLQPYLTALGLVENTDYTFHETTSSTSITTLTTETFLPRALAGIPQSIVLLSGDGGIVDLINGLLSSGQPHTDSYTKPELAVLPLGTGNALANSTLVTADRTLGMATLARGRPKALPIFRADFSAGSCAISSGEQHVETSSDDAAGKENLTVFGAVVFSYGLHASLVGDSDTPEYRKHGSQRFAMAANNLLNPPDGSPPHAYHGRTSIKRTKSDADWEDVPGETQAYVLATYASQLEAGFTISPASKPLDGVLRLVHFGPLKGGGEAIMDVMKAAYGGGKHVEDERVGYHEIEAMRIEVYEEEETWRRVCVDGKIFVVGRGGSVVVQRVEGSVVDFVTVAT